MSENNYNNDAHQQINAPNSVPAQDESARQSSYSQAPQPPYNQSPYGETPQQPYNQQFYGQPPAYPYSATPTDNTKVFSVLSYIGILWLVGLIAERENPKVKFHVNQGIVLTIFSAALSIAVSILSAILIAISPVLFVISSLLWFVDSVVIIVWMVLGIINASKGINKPLPLIGSLFTILK